MDLKGDGREADKGKPWSLALRYQINIEGEILGIILLRT